MRKASAVHKKDASIDDYEKIQTRSTIESSLITNSLMNNFGDFCIVYSNDQTVGKLASSTKSLLGSGSLYQTLEGFITRDTTNDGWTTGVDDYYARLFYVKRINDNAILLAAIYTADLDALMETSDQMSDMTIRIFASGNRIIYSTDDSEVGGTPLDATISDKVSSSTRSTFIRSGQLVTVNTCGDDWKIVSTVPTSTILAEVYEIRSFTASTPVLSGASRTGWYVKPATMYAISANTDHPSEAAERLQFLVSSEDMALQQKLDKGVPFNQAAKDILQANGELESIMIDADNTIDNTDTILMNPMFESSTLTNAFSQACTSVHYGEATIEEAAKTAYETMKSAF